MIHLNQFCQVFRQIKSVRASLTAFCRYPKAFILKMQKEQEESYSGQGRLFCGKITSRQNTMQGGRLNEPGGQSVGSLYPGCSARAGTVALSACSEQGTGDYPEHVPGGESRIPEQRSVSEQAAADQAED